jgi:hypothetical protein
MRWRRLPLDLREPSRPAVARRPRMSLRRTSARAALKLRRLSPAYRGHPDKPDTGLVFDERPITWH